PSVPDDLAGYWVLDQIKETVREGGHKIVNLSLGPTLAVEDDMEPNRWTSELDQLAWDNDVLFVVAAGNDGDADREAGLHRVQVPADMANGLTVGACDAPSPAAKWSRAPYSSMGPGRHGNRVQPMGVQFGGASSQMFNVLRTDGTFLEAAGTSFAAPVVTHSLAELVNHLPRVNANVLRAFAVHFAERPRQHVKLRDEIGHGRLPLSFVDSLECNADEVHVLLIDDIQHGDLAGYQLPVPDAVSSQIKMRVTMVYSSPVDPTQPTEYTNAALELSFRPHQHRFTFKPPKGDNAKSVVLDLRSPDARALMTDGWSPSQEPATKTLSTAKGRTEQQLRDAGKWETIRTHQITLNPDEVDRPRLEVSYVARRAGGLDREPTEVPFAVLVTVTDPSSAGTLYDAVSAQFSALRPTQRATQRVRTRSASEQSIWR
ncbi:S8 family serine peptidase, partial [Prescottella equi]|uniref:S8 family serine peptidase n=1 Tax=Rhodococcus hoagii TaxID=43767 RepID=UPI000ADDF075